MFVYGDETFVVAESETIIGFFEVIDSEDCILGVGATPKFAVENAIEELEFHKEFIMLEMEEIGVEL